MCLSLVTSLGVSLTMRPTVCRLSQNTVSCWSMLRSRLLKKRPHHRSQAQVCDSDSISALVVEVVTVVCFLDNQSIVPPNSWKTLPSVLRRVVMSSAKLASDAALSTRARSLRVPSSRARYLVPRRYLRFLSTAAACCGPGFLLASARALDACALSGLEIVEA
jgi:hypothetical protein